MGQTREQVVSALGEPERTVRTARGHVLFFGRTLVETEGGRVTYVSVTPGFKKRHAPKPLRAKIKIMGDAAAEPKAGTGEQEPADVAMPEGEVTLQAGLPQGRGGRWSTFALNQNKVELVARLKRALLMDSYVMLFRPYGPRRETHAERKKLSCHDVRDKVGAPVRCYGQELDMRDPGMVDLQTESSLSGTP